MHSHESDIEAILDRRHDNGADFWSTPDGRIYVGNPFSTISSLGMLHELGVGREHEAVEGGIQLILDRCRDDGRIQVAPKAPMYPCYTSEAARTLCRFGLNEHESVRRTVAYLLDNVHETGGWRCSFGRFGRGPETEFANPGATLYALDVLRFFPDYRSSNESVDRAVESLLAHWERREPIGPCHFGIGSLFLQVEFPFLRYNLFFWVYVLSWFECARDDARYTDAVATLQGKLSEDDEVIVARPHRNLGTLRFCSKGEVSAPATARYRELIGNLA